jgi:hypothetical protein
MQTTLTLRAREQDAGRTQIAGVWRSRLGSVLTQLAIWLPLSIAAGLPYGLCVRWQRQR